MTSIVADRLDFNTHAEKVTAFFDDMRNFKSIMPEQVEDWKAGKEECTFFIRNLGKLGMNKGDFNPPHQYEFISNQDSKVNFTLVFHFHGGTDSSSIGYFEIIATMNPLVEMMAKRPLTNFVNILTKNFRQNMY